MSHPNDSTLFGVLGFPKLILRPPRSVERVPDENLTAVLKQRVEFLRQGDWDRLWADLLKDGPPARTQPDRAAKRPREDEGVIPDSLQRRIQQAVADGTPQKAVQMLHSVGIHEPSDPKVW